MNSPILSEALVDSEVLESDPIWPLAKSVAERSTMRFKLGAVLVKRNRVISTGCNTKKTHPKFGSGWMKSLHAEGSCIYAAIKKGVDVSGSTLYVYRRNGNMAKPCDCCLAIIERHGIRKVIYTYD